MNPRFIISYVYEFFYAAVVVDFWMIFEYSGTLLDHPKERLCAPAVPRLGLGSSARVRAS